MSEDKMPNIKIFDIRISRALFSFILACFLLPFITISCGTEQFTLNGLQVVGGADLDPSMAGDEVRSDLGIAITVLLAMVGLVLTYFKKRYLSLAIISAVGTVMLWLYRLRMITSAANASSGDAFIVAQVAAHFDIGYWIILSLFLISTALNTYLVWYRNKECKSMQDTHSSMNQTESKFTKDHKIKTDLEI